MCRSTVRRSAISSTSSTSATKTATVKARTTDNRITPTTKKGRPHGRLFFRLFLLKSLLSANSAFSVLPSALNRLSCLFTRALLLPLRLSTVRLKIPSPSAARLRRLSAGRPHFAGHAVQPTGVASKFCAHFVAPIPPAPAASPRRELLANHSSRLSLRLLRSICGTSRPSHPASVAALLHRATSDPETPAPSSIAATPANPPVPKPSWFSQR